MVESALEVAEDVLYSSEMGLMRVVHVKTHLLDCIGDVRPGEGEVLEALDPATVGSWVTDRDTRVRGDLHLSVNRHGVVLAVGPTSMLKDIQSIQVLLHEEVVVSLLHKDAKEVEGTQVLHGELPLEGCTDEL
jgi:hypothetical protein